MSLRPAPAYQDELATYGKCRVSTYSPPSLNSSTMRHLLRAGEKGSHVTVVRSVHVSCFQQMFLLSGFPE